VLQTALLFLLGGLVTAIFSGSLFVLARDVSLTEVLVVGMIVPSFTWVVQCTASALLLPAAMRDRYWRDLGWICALGSFALLPAAVINLTMAQPDLRVSIANVLASVSIMALDLFRRAKADGIPPGWPVAWCLTISLNMAIFAYSSRHWWGV
jgi:hypothetical protein